MKATLVVTWGSGHCIGSDKFTRMTIDVETGIVEVSEPRVEDDPGLQEAMRAIWAKSFSRPTSPDRSVAMGVDFRNVLSVVLVMPDMSAVVLYDKGV